MDKLVRGTKYRKNAKDYNITDYRCWLCHHVPQIPSFLAGVNLIREERFLQPFANFGQTNSSIDWWKSFTKIKHSDIDNFKEGNLKNCMNGLAALATLFTLVDLENGSDVRLFPEIGPQKFKGSMQKFLLFK